MSFARPLPPRRALVRAASLLFILSCTFALAPVARAVEHAEVCRYCRAAAIALAAGADGATAERHYAPDRQVDVQHIKLDVTPNFKRRTVQGTATLRFTPIAKPLETLRLDGVDLKVSDVRSSHKVRDWSTTRNDVTIVFDEAIPADTEAFVEIDYSAEPVEGLYFRTKGMGLPAEDEHCWTQGETHEARHWFPCFDYPNERASSELICHVPADMTVVSNGELKSDDESDDGKTKTFHWLQEKPHASYLICFVAGKLAKVEGKHGDTPLAFYAQPTKAEHIDNAFRDTADIMEFFEKEIGVDFPWAKYDQATISDFMWGGMENTTITTLTQATIYEREDDDFRAARTRGLNAHEMAHQWFGDYVTCKDWSHLWLNEGFATYYALLYEGHKYGRDDLLYGLYLDARDDIFLAAGDNRPIVYRQYKAPMEQFDFRSYPKGSWCLHMLRSQLGEELYREAIHTYLERHALTSVESDDLREVFEELSGQPLDRFFDQWLYHGGQPELTINYDWNAKERTAHVSIEQTQATGDDVLVFQFPAKLRFIVDGKTTDKTFDVTEKKHDFYVRLDAEPQVVRFDPDYTLLAKVEFKKSDAQFEADLKNEDDGIGRVLACEGLASRRSRDAVKLLKHALQNDKFWGVRQVAARALRQIRTDEAVAALVASTDQDDIRVRRSVVDELGQCYHDDAEAKLLEIAGDDDEFPVVAAAAVRGLGRVGGEKARKAVEAALASESFSDERAIAALYAIADMNDPKLAPAVIKFIRERGAEMDARELAQGFLTLASISQRGQRRTTAFEFLSEYLSDPRTPLNALAVEALGQLHDPRARTLIEPFAAEGQNDRLIAAAKGALAILDRQGEFVPGEVGELRREVRELRTSQSDLQNALDEMKSKASAAGADLAPEEPPTTEAAEATDAVEATDQADDGETKQPE